VHWRANIHSKITGATVPTELVDLVEVRNGRIVSYIEFFAQR
jgi:ketosteroid isomerase-like protein